MKKRCLHILKIILFFNFFTFLLFFLLFIIWFFFMKLNVFLIFLRNPILPFLNHLRKDNKSQPKNPLNNKNPNPRLFSRKNPLKSLMKKNQANPFNWLNPNKQLNPLFRLKLLENLQFRLKKPLSQTLMKRKIVNLKWKPLKKLLRLFRNRLLLNNSKKK